MIRVPFLALMLSLFFYNLSAQEIDLDKINQAMKQRAAAGVVLSGTLKDSVSSETLSFGSVTLTRKGSTAEDGISSDSLGYFEFRNVLPGEYTLSVFYVGYTKTDKMIHIDSSGKDRALGNVWVRAGATQLNEVKIVDFKQLIEQRADGHVYNAEKDFTNKGITAEQVLRKVPMVTVDLEGNVQLRGNGNIKVLIDGKPSTLIAASVKDALRQIPADNIKSVEVITSPGAKYDGEGVAGVLNIITKKNLMKGVSGSLYSALSYNMPKDFFSGYGGFNLNYRNKKFGLAANAGYSKHIMAMDMDAYRTDFPNTAQQMNMEQQTFYKGAGDFVWSQVTADYQIDSQQSVQAGVNYNPGTWNQDQQMQTRFSSVVLPGFSRNNHTEIPRSNIGFNASYSKKFKSNPKRTLDLLAQYALESSNQQYQVADTREGPEEIFYKEKNNNESKNKEFTVQADYVHPLKKPDQKIEVGLKFIDRNIFSDYELRYWTPASGADFIADPKRTNQLTYGQQVGSAYGQFSTRIVPNLTMIAGLRYEFTHIGGKQQEANSDFKSEFHNVMPNLNFALDLKNFNKLKLAYNQRIERPSMQYVNPFVNYSDQYNISYGNPELVPAVSHNVELGYSTYLGKTSLNFSSFYRYTGNAIEAVTVVDANNVSRTTFQNAARNHTIGLDMYGGTTLFERWMINLNGSLYYKMLESPSLDIRNEGWQYTGNLYTSFKLSDRFSLAGYGMLSGNQVQLQGSQSGWYYYYLGLQTTVLRGKGTIVLAAENFFHPTIKLKTQYSYQNADYTLYSNYYGRGFRLSFNWSFGKMNFVQSKKIKNDDLKAGESNQQGIGGGR